MELIIYAIGCIVSMILMYLHYYLLKKKYGNNIFPKLGKSYYISSIIICTLLSWFGAGFLIYSIGVSWWKGLL